MTQPHWFTVFFGGGGLAAIAALVTKGLLSQKDERIKYLEKKNQDLNTQVSEERTKASKILEEFRNHMESVEMDRFSDADKLRVQEAFGLLNRFGSKLEDFRECEKAAEWLGDRKQEWAAEVAEQTALRHRRFFLLPRSSHRFRKDIERYLEWVQLGLSKYGGRTQNTPIHKFIQSPAISSYRPYVFAIRYLMESKDFSSLGEQSRLYLQTVLDRSVKQIKTEFSPSYVRKKKNRAS